jgi:hypothetical protein
MRLVSYLVLAGCSAMFVRGPTTGPTCTTSELVPALDGATAIISFATLSAEVHDPPNHEWALPLAFGAFAAGVIYALSAIEGHSKAFACRASHPTRD